MGTEYHAAVVWLPNGAIDADAAMAAARATDWATSWPHAWRSELVAGDARSLLDDFGRESGNHEYVRDSRTEVPPSVDSAITALRTAISGLDDATPMTDKIFALYGLCWSAMMVQMIHAGGDDQFDVTSQGTVIALGGDDRGAEWDRLTVAKLGMTLTDPDFAAFREVLLAGGAVPPSAWRITRA